MAAEQQQTGEAAAAFRRAHDPIWDRSGPVYGWLGLAGYEPEGLHGRNRKRLVERHSRIGRDGVRFARALARAYPLNRELRLMQLLRPQRLDDDLWRMIYALMVQGGPIRRSELIITLTRLTSDDRKIADAEAVRLYASWSAQVAHGG